MLKLLTLLTLMHHVLGANPKVCTDKKINLNNEWKSLIKFNDEFSNACNKIYENEICVGYYLSKHPYVFNGYISHTGIAVLNNKDIKTYGLTNSGRWNNPDLLLKGGLSKSGKNIPSAYKFKFIGIKKTNKNNLAHFKRDKVNYSLLGYNGDNCADAVIDVASKLNHNITCNFLGINIPDFCIVK